jgi:hypothetical protein
MDTANPLDTYRHAWLVMWPAGLLLLSGFGVYFLRQIKRSIKAATQQQLVHLISEGRFFMIDHPDLFTADAQKRGETEQDRLVARTGGWPAYLMRRNILMTLELLYFQNKYKAIDKAFFISHCNHIRNWFSEEPFLETWENSKNMHVPEFQRFVDGLIKNTVRS